VPTNQFKLVLDITWCNGRRNALMGSDTEKVSNVQRPIKETRKEGLKSYADMTIYPARLVPYIVTSLPPPQTSYNYHHLVTFDTSFSFRWLKCMQLVHVHPTRFCIQL